MNLSDFYPSPAVLFKSELTVLSYLKTNTYISQQHTEFATQATAYYSRNKSDKTGFEFQSYLDMWHAPLHRNQSSIRQGKRKRNVRLFLAARIEAKDGKSFDNITYCLCVARIRASRYTVLRKFHFDGAIDDGNANSRQQQHPILHLQYCGEMMSFMRDQGCRDTQFQQLHPWLSEPRILFWPMSLALLVDMALHEFPNPESERFRATSEWRSIVRDQESLVRRPFCEKCVEIIADKGGRKRTLSDELYLG
jgi:hypothetical protein